MTSSHPVILALGYLRGNKGLFIVAATWRALWVLVPMQVPIFAGAIVDALSGDTVSLYGTSWGDASRSDALRVAALGLLVLAFARGVGAYGFTLTSARFGKRFVANLRKRLVRHLMRLSLRQHEAFGSAELLDRTLRDTQRMRTFADRVFVRVPSSVVRAAYPIAALFILDARLAALSLSVLPLQWAVSSNLGKRIHHASRSSLSSRSTLTATLKESLDGMETVHVVRAHPVVTESLDANIDDIEHHELRVNRLTAALKGTTWAATSVGVALAWWFGAGSVFAGEMTLGSLVVFIGLLQFAYRPFREFTNVARAYRQGLASLERIHELLQTEPASTGNHGTTALDVVEGGVELRDVSVRWGEAFALRNVSGSIPAKRLTSIAGPSGAGKSTLLRLVAKLEEPSIGDIAIDGQRLSDVSANAVHEHVAAVPQIPILFTGTIEDNVTLGCPNVTRGEVLTVCRAAGLDGLLSTLKHGVRSRVGRGGLWLSRAESLRVALARALLKRPEILLLDEPTSSLDEGSELELLTLLQHLCGEMTVVVATQRLQTVRRTDHVIALDAGRAIAEGTHDALLARSHRYRKLFPTESLLHA